MSNVCGCGCGTALDGLRADAVYASDACRKRAERAESADKAVTYQGGELATRQLGEIVAQLSLDIPADPEAADERADALGVLTNGGDWAVAAVVSARTTAVGQGARSDLVNGDQVLSYRRYAAKGIRGLTHHDTVKFYAEAWESRFEKPALGETVALPDEPFPKRKTSPAHLASTTFECYTPAKYVDAAGEVLGGFDLDPASSPEANETVGATEIFTKDDDGLAQEWHGRVWLNPPYGRSMTSAFVAKLVEEFEAKRITAAITVLNAYGFDADWFQPLWQHPLCFTDHRINFYGGSPTFGSLFAYLGPAEERFAKVFRQFGQVVKTWP